MNSGLPSHDLCVELEKNRKKNLFQRLFSLLFERKQSAPTLAEKKVSFCDHHTIVLPEEQDLETLTETLASKETQIDEVDPVVYHGARGFIERKKPTREKYANEQHARLAMQRKLICRKGSISPALQEKGAQIQAQRLHAFARENKAILFYPDMTDINGY